MQNTAFMDSPIGRLTLCSDGAGLTAIRFDGDGPEPCPEACFDPADPILAQALRWLCAYFAGDDPGPVPPLHPSGTAFQQTVWARLREIPYGRTLSYGALAAQTAPRPGRARVSARAVGAAVGRNPLPILIPCHRVVGADGSLTGYAGGLDRKFYLLKRERGALLETPDLLLAKASPADWRGLYRNVWSHAETARYMLWSVTTSAAEARARLTRTLAWQQTHEAFTVYLRKTGEAIGFAGFRFVGAETAEDTGVALGPAFVRKGYGTQIVRALCARAKALGAKTMILSAREQNAASRGLIESLGFRRTETEPRTDERDGSAYRLIFYRRTL